MQEARCHTCVPKPFKVRPPPSALFRPSIEGGRDGEGSSREGAGSREQGGGRRKDGGWRVMEEDGG
eukprot:9676116-Karenia_brevis.AAC.1